MDGQTTILKIMNKIISYLQIQTIIFLLWLMDFKSQTTEFFIKWWKSIINEKDEFKATIKVFAVTISCTTLLWLINQYYFGWCYDNLWNSYTKLALLGYSLPIWFFSHSFLTIIGCMPVKKNKVKLPRSWFFKVEMFIGRYKIFTYISYFIKGILLLFTICIILLFFYLIYYVYTTPSC